MFPSFNDDYNFFDEPSNFLPDHQNPSSKHDPDPPFLNFPSPFLDEHESPLSQIFLQTHRMAVGDQTNNDTDEPRGLVGKEASREDAAVVVAPLRRRNLGVVPRRRAGKKDRHSKICTAQGVRDRRMRLSLQVARKFFDLQDMLGYDKASKTIEWLFTKSKKAIKELVEDHPQENHFSISDAKSESFLSECEVISGIGENKDETKTQKSSTKSKESREKARARARSRTREKMMVKSFEYHSNPNDIGHVKTLGFPSSPFDGANQERVSPYEADFNSFEVQQLADVGIMEKFDGNSSSSSTTWPVSENCSASVSGYADCESSFMGFWGTGISMMQAPFTQSLSKVTLMQNFQELIHK